MGEETSDPEALITDNRHVVSSWIYRRLRALRSSEREQRIPCLASSWFRISSEIRPGPRNRDMRSTMYRREFLETMARTTTSVIREQGILSSRVQTVAAYAHCSESDSLDFSRQPFENRRFSTHLRVSIISLVHETHASNAEKYPDTGICPTTRFRGNVALQELSA